MNRKLGNPEKISVERLSKKYANIRMTSISYFLYADCLKIENIGLVIVHAQYIICLLYTSDAADDMQCVDLGGRRIIKKVIRMGASYR